MPYKHFTLNLSEGMEAQLSALLTSECDALAQEPPYSSEHHRLLMLDDVRDQLRAQGARHNGRMGA